MAGALIDIANTGSRGMDEGVGFVLRIKFMAPDIFGFGRRNIYYMLYLDIRLDLVYPLRISLAVRRVMSYGHG